MSAIPTDVYRLRTDDPVSEQQEQSRYEAMLAEVSSLFGNAPVRQLDAAIEDVQRLVCERLVLDGCCLFQVCDKEVDLLLLTHRHGSEGPPHQRRPAPSPLFHSYWVLSDATPRAYVRIDARSLFPWICEQVRRGQPVVMDGLHDLPADAAIDRDTLRRYQTKSLAAVPLSIGGTVLGFMTFAITRDGQHWSTRQVQRLQLITEIFANALTRQRADSRAKQGNERLHEANADVRRLQARLPQESLCLRQDVQPHRHRAAAIVGNSDVLTNVIRQAEQVAATDSTVLILGETGTGKELLAQYMHSISPRSARAFIATSVAAIPTTLLESELFGREKGAYTGALSRELGRFELADGGTLFLDEVGEMPMETQVKLLRVLQSGEFERLGSGQPLRTNVRVIAATNRELTKLIQAGAFRQDLFYRLNVFPITLPPLRDRPEDIPLLVWAFVKELSEKMGKPFERVGKKDLDAMQCYAWPGNVRELRNVVERSMILSEGPALHLALPESQVGGERQSSRRLEDIERRHILVVLASTQNRIGGPGGAAEVLGLKPSTLYSLMARLGIPRRRGAAR